MLMHKLREQQQSGLSPLIDEPEFEKFFVLGLDLGQTQDPSALVIDEVTGEGPAFHAIRYIEQFKLRTPYQVIADRVALLMSQLNKKKGRHLVVDATGVGRPVIEMLMDRNLDVVPVTITGGYDAVQTRGPLGFEHRVPKRDLVMAVQMVLASERIVIAQGLADRELLRRELTKCKIKLTSSGNDTYEAWRESDHDDLVLATALAVWYSEHQLVSVVDPPPRPEARPLGGF